MLLRETLREVMQKHELDATAMATRLGVSANTVWRYLAGTVLPSPTVILRISKIGGLDARFLLEQKAIEQSVNLSRVRESAEPLDGKATVPPPQRRERNRTMERTALMIERLLREFGSFREGVEERLTALEGGHRTKRRAKK